MRDTSRGNERVQQAGRMQRLIKKQRPKCFTVCFAPETNIQQRRSPLLVRRRVSTSRRISSVRLHWHWRNRITAVIGHDWITLMHVNAAIRYNPRRRTPIKPPRELQSRSDSNWRAGLRMRLCPPASLCPPGNKQRLWLTEKITKKFSFPFSVRKS